MATQDIANTDYDPQSGLEPSNSNEGKVLISSDAFDASDSESSNSSSGTPSSPRSSSSSRAIVTNAGTSKKK